LEKLERIKENLKKGYIKDIIPDKKQFVKIVDGRSPVELLETNIISQQEYDEAIANPLNYLEYIEMFGPSITLKRKPEYLIIPGFVVYVVSYIIFTI
jgi:hypothetical protein